jgi:N-methylhydantoinase A
MAWRLGVDTGGTFTDVALVDEAGGLVAVRKVPSNRLDPSAAILRGITEILDESGVTPEGVAFLGHGTTVATNAVLEGTTAPVGMLTTQGMRDVLELARQRRPHLYDMDVPKPDPVVPRHLRLEVAERLAADGTVVRRLDLADAQAQLARLADAGVEAIAICLLHAYANSDHERQLRELAQTVLPDVPVSLSSEVHPEFREHGRFSTTVLNAALVPVMRRYLEQLSVAVHRRGIPSPVRVIQSNGGVMSAAAAAEYPVSTLFSGPSAGVLGAVQLARTAGEQDIITFDMGGTSTDVCLVRSGEVPVVHEREIAGKPVLGAMVDIHSVGSGGGSIAWVDDGRLLKVGPQSAGATPGPACYGRGGTVPTVTDANVVLGYLHPDSPLAGSLQVDVPAARAALATRVGDPLGLDVDTAAHGVLRVLQASLVRAVRAISVERGTDPRDFTLVPFGGAGPLHAAQLARELGIRKVLVPPSPGILCAYGALSADLRADFGATCLTSATTDGLAEVKAAFAALEARAREWLSREGVAEQAAFERGVELRYARQNYQLAVPMPGEPDDSVLTRVVDRFHQLHEVRYGYAAPSEPVHVVTVRLTAVVPTSRSWPSTPPSPAGDAGPVGNRRVFFEDDGWVDCPVYDRARLGTGFVLHGPAVVGQLDATTVVLPAQTFRVDDGANLIIEEAR